MNLPELTGKAKYCKRPIVNKYREGKVKRTPEGEWNRYWNRMFTKSRRGSSYSSWERAYDSGSAIYSVRLPQADCLVRWRVVNTWDQTRWIFRLAIDRWRKQH